VKLQRAETIAAKRQEKEARERGGRHIPSKTMPRPNSAKATVQLYKKGAGGFRPHVPQPVSEVKLQRAKKEQQKGGKTSLSREAKKYQSLKGGSS
jgi:hypothetical protein